MRCVPDVLVPKQPFQLSEICSPVTCLCREGVPKPCGCTRLSTPARSARSAVSHRTYRALIGWPDCRSTVQNRGPGPSPSSPRFCIQRLSASSALGWKPRVCGPPLFVWSNRTECALKSTLDVRRLSASDTRRPLRYISVRSARFRIPVGVSGHASRIACTSSGAYGLGGNFRPLLCGCLAAGSSAWGADVNLISN